MRQWFDKLSCAIATWSGHPLALVITAFAVTVGFLISDVDRVNIAVSLLSLALLFVLQASQNRDGAALQAKLDELLRAVPEAKDELRHLDEKTIDEVQKVRDKD